LAQMLKPFLLKCITLFFLFLLFSTDFFHVFNRQLLVQSSKAQWWVIVYLICGFLFKKIKNKIKIRKLDISSIAWCASSQFIYLHAHTCVCVCVCVCETVGFRNCILSHFPPSI
jgi:hypothetical protein